MSLVVAAVVRGRLAVLADDVRAVVAALGLVTALGLVVTVGLLLAVTGLLLAVGLSAVGLLALGSGGLLALLALLHRAAGHPARVREQRLRLLGVLAAERAAVVGVRLLPGERQVAADRHGGQAERLQYDLRQFLAVERPGHRPAHPLVGEGAVGAVEGQLRVGRFQ